jgi:Domain of unknown function (DUF4124)
MVCLPSLCRGAVRLGVIVGIAVLWTAGAHAAPEKAGKVYKWTDEKGEVHYGDAVPPQYADKDQTILNHQGVTVGAVTGRRSAEQVAADEASHAADAAARETQLRGLQRDQYLLATYLSAQELETLRDRRLEILDGQVRALAQYVEQLEARAGQLEERMRRFRPYAAVADAPALPEPLAAEVVHTVSDLRAQERSLAAKRDEVDRTRAQFADDLQRFLELKQAGRSAAHAR